METTQIKAMTYYESTGITEAYLGQGDRDSDASPGIVLIQHGHGPRPPGQLAVPQPHLACLEGETKIKN